MSQLFDKMMQIVKSDYLTYFWWLVIAGYILAYAVANLLARAGDQNQGTIFSRCRKAWSIAFFIHTLAAVAVASFWFIQNGIFSSFWFYFPFYIVVAVTDLCFAIGLLVTRAKYLNFHEQQT